MLKTSTRRVNMSVIDRTPHFYVNTAASTVFHRSKNGPASISLAQYLQVFSMFTVINCVNMLAAKVLTITQWKKNSLFEIHTISSRIPGLSALSYPSFPTKSNYISRLQMWVEMFVASWRWDLMKILSLLLTLRADKKLVSCLCLTSGQ